MQLESVQRTVASLRDEDLSSSLLQSMQYSGTGMHPLINSGDRIILKKANTENLSFGDIIAYEYRGRILVNRLFYSYIDRTKKCTILVVKGDNRHNFRRTVCGVYLGHVVAICSNKKSLPLHTRCARLCACIFALLSGIEGCIYKIFRLKNKKNPGITILAYFLTPLSSLLKISTWIDDVPNR